MLKKLDKAKGLVRVYWQDVRDRVEKVAPTLAKIIDDLKPGKTLPLYLAYYPYGALIADSEAFYLPREEGINGFTLNDPKVPRELIEELGYAKDSLPMGIVLEKKIEYSIELKDEEMTMSWSVYRPGSFFPFSRILSKKSQRVYTPNGLLTLYSGIKSSLMLPNIGCATQHAGLQRDFNIQSSVPKSLYQHSNIFKEIVNSPAAECKWRSCMLYFSAKWIEELHHNKAWMGLKMYLHELAWYFFEYQRNRAFYDINFSIIQDRKHLKPNPYLTDTARHLFAIAVGAAPGFVPATTDEGLPLSLLQQVYIESYGLKKYFPTIMQATHYKFERDKLPIYYSLKHPSIYIFSPKSRKVFSTLVEMRELEHIMRVFTEEWSKDNETCSDTIMSKTARQVEFNYFHNENDRHLILQPSAAIPNLDERFIMSKSRYRSSQMGFASDSPFVRGCVSIKSSVK